MPRWAGNGPASVASSEQARVRAECPVCLLSRLWCRQLGAQERGLHTTSAEVGEVGPWGSWVSQGSQAQGSGLLTVPDQVIGEPRAPGCRPPGTWVSAGGSQSPSRAARWTGE